MSTITATSQHADCSATRYLEASSDFAKYLALRKHTSQEILAHISHRLFSEFQVVGAALATLNSDNALVIAPQTSAFLGSSLENNPTFSVFESNPLSACFRSNRASWSTSVSELQASFPSLKQAENKAIGVDFKSVICTPVEVHGTPRGVFSLFSSLEFDIDPEFLAFVTNIGNLFSLYLLHADPMKWASSTSFGGDEERSVEPLTDRQMLILQLMASGKTNNFISESLGYSESTVRQETIKIYAKLHCDGRAEASKIYRERYANPDS
jgi:DNA-binding CsgD family transcriptional regulator